MEKTIKLICLTGILSIINILFANCIGKKELLSAEQAIDIVLIYHGDKSRLEFSPEQIKHYVYREKDGKVDWLYDGFLFVEFHMDIDGTDYDFETDDNNRTLARKEQWEILLERTFAEGKGPDALEKVMENLIEQGIDIPYKRRVIFAVPKPVVTHTDWGELDGRALNFGRTEDRIAAVYWYIDQVLSVWKEKKYKYLDLEGFYWTKEEVFVKDKDDELMRAMKHKLGDTYEFSWIPYYGSPDAHDWKDYHFDIAYQQPNYFFEETTPMEILTGAIEYAGRHGLSLEMEFDSRLMDNKVYMGKYYDYIEEFRKDGAWDTKRITHYEGGDGWYKMALSTKPEVKEAYECMVGILNKRKKELAVTREK